MYLILGHPVLEKEDNSLQGLLSSPILDIQDRHVGRGSNARRKGRKKTEIKTQLRLPSRKVMTTRRPEWREVATTCGKLGHWVQHHTFECVNNRICKTIADTVFCTNADAV